MSKSDGNGAINAIAKSDYHVKVVVVNMPSYRSCTLGLNCQIFLDSSILLQLSAIDNLPYMMADKLFCRIEQICQVLLRQPDVIVLKPCHASRLPGNRTIDGKPSRQTHVFIAHRNLHDFIFTVIMAVPSVRVEIITTITATYFLGGGNASSTSTSRAPASDALRGDMTLRPVFCSISILAFLATPPPLAATL